MAFRKNASKRHNGRNRHNLPTKKSRRLKSTVTKAHTISPSVRTTIPREIIEMLDWDPGDVLSWTIEKRGRKWIVKIRRLE